jgi:hypothetical protein
MAEESRIRLLEEKTTESWYDVAFRHNKPLA